MSADLMPVLTSSVLVHSSNLDSTRKLLAPSLRRPTSGIFSLPRRGGCPPRYRPSCCSAASRYVPWLLREAGRVSGVTTLDPARLRDIRRVTNFAYVIKVEVVHKSKSALAGGNSVNSCNNDVHNRP